MLYSCQEVGVTALARFNELPEARAEEELISCCASPVWVREVLAGRPYPSLAAVTTAADAALAALPWEEVARALDAHPRIGAAPQGEGREVAWSRREQAGVDHGDQEVVAALAEANRAYERRFGHIFLIFASGRTDAEMLAAARARLTNDEATERATVRAELGKIVKLRLERLLGGEEPSA